MSRIFPSTLILRVILFAGALFLVASGAMSKVGVFEEDWDSLGQGGDGVDSFSEAALFPGAVPGTPSSAEGSRCQYNDPGNPDSVNFGDGSCTPWSGHDWHVHLPFNSPDPKSFSGDGSLHLGTHAAPDDASFDSYTSGQISAAVSPPIALSRRAPKLSFWHILSLVDDRTFSAIPVGQTGDRAMVQIALSTAAGSILSDWQTLQPTKNAYTGVSESVLIDCKFDPVDDGSTEDDLTTPPGQQPFGPSSTCADSPNNFTATAPGRKAWSALGDWTSTNRKDVGKATGTKAGRLGNMGSGVWVQARFDLSAFAGQTVRIRLLFSGLEEGSGTRWSDIFGNGLGNGVRGWILDDFRVTGTAN